MKDLLMTAISPMVCRRATNYLLMLLVLSFGASAGMTASAAVHTWASLGDGTYSNASNWFPATAPGANDFVTFEIGFDNPYSVRFPGKRSFEPPGDYFASHLRVRDSNLTFTGTTQSFVSTSTYTITSTVQAEVNRGVIIGLSVGDQSSLTLRHVGSGGSILARVNTMAATIGDGPGSEGTLNVATGAFFVTGSEFGQRQFIVGSHGRGVVNLTGGSASGVNVSGSNSTTSLGRYADGVGEVNVGNGSIWTNRNQLWVGENGVGKFTVKEGGDLVTSSNAGNSNIIGVFAGSSGDVTVTGAGSSWLTSNAIQVGNAGSGRLTINRGGTVDGSAPTINTVGGSGHGDVTITDPGSNWVARGTLFVGSTGTGRVSVLNGGYLFTGSARVGGLDAGSGEVVVGGKYSEWDVLGGSLEIGYVESGFGVAPGTVTINTGGLVFVPLDVDLDSSGTLRLNGGTLATGSIGSRDLASQRFEGKFDWISGKLHTNFIYGSVVNQGGVLSPGVLAGPGVVAGRTTIDGHYTQQAAAALEIEIGGVTREGEYDFVYVEGAATIAGELQLSLINNFMPTADQTFTILDSLNSITGSFSNVLNGQRLTMPNGMDSFQVNYGPGSLFDPNRIVLSNFAHDFIAADFDEDGDVDDDDLSLWRNNFGTANNADHRQGDADHDLDVDGNDFLLWQRQYGLGVIQPKAASGGIPEPTSLLLGMAAGLGIVVTAQRAGKHSIKRCGRN
ncbi:MAG: hypothetical protein C0485_16510 [Pirellula sp.]|nr:hypothetical protein [Pirellula sp.]